MRIVVDTNLYISALINGNSRQRLDALLLDATHSILLDDTLLAELYTVICRPKFRRYISLAQADQFISLLLERATRVQTLSTVQYSPDPKDDFLLALCRDGQADYLLTGNKIDLLDLKQFEATQIMTLADFLLQYYNRR